MLGPWDHSLGPVHDIIDHRVTGKILRRNYLKQECNESHAQYGVAWRHLCACACPASAPEPGRHIYKIPRVIDQGIFILLMDVHLLILYSYEFANLTPGTVAFSP
jgi:hypothetical protein